MEPVEEQDVLQQARQLLREAPLIDGHNDFAYILRGWFAGTPQIQEQGRYRSIPIGQTDVERVKKSGLGGQFWSAFVPAPPEEHEPHLRAFLHTVQQIDLIAQVIDSAPDTFEFAYSAKSITRIFGTGKIACLVGIEGLHQIGGSMAALRQLHRLGVRYATLCHDTNNEFADSATAQRARHGGLSPRGSQAIREMNRIGMMIDLSHTSDDCQRQVLALSQSPVIFSHSSCYALRAHPRNVSDDVLALLKKNNGLIMITFLRELSGIDELSSQTASCSTVVDHIEYAARCTGWEHVGVGSDFDGMLEGPTGLDDVTAFPCLIAEMLRRDISRDQMQMVMGGNLLRVLKDVEDHATRQRNDGASVLQDTVLPVWTEAQREMLLAKGAERGLVTSDTSQTV
ncbi:unnamed protein product [Zymoseptoria tritici ST99CH_1A5]|uniref:Dipeptidase n=3 Tax=Zymoseptoria tritici TaxID=1047171 RepID=F9X217_ZYMTI|nr:dipeptidase [Zymoseptoria tritici IPO323]EGP89695.1 dipeptidase [Zymoseptoria tritici IPO323]SMR45652.1 unnamed protein product [Zymoseptoria tritici ST99CH_1E4]SMR46913.1 unnamed protein product [Zymoseptoria tritici ST99CH_3D1]SMY20807.1 unnamed protein product [Zymoseptoria tritici ST99CH_1A5]